MSWYMDTILRKFDPKVREHVLFLKKLNDLSKNLSDGRIDDICENNPWTISVKPLDIPQLHFCLAAKYTDSVLSKTAWIPE